jgi:hypothetical protein
MSAPLATAALKFLETRVMAWRAQASVTGVAMMDT